MHDCTDLLLAGGQSRRMGRDKATLVFEGRALWERQLATIRAAGSEQLIISGPLLGPWEHAGVPMVPDAQPGRGPLGALATVLPQVATRWVRVLAIDLPLVTPAFLLALLERAEATSRGQAPWEAGRFHPTVAVYPAKAAATALRRMKAGEFALQPFVRELEEQQFIERWPISPAEAWLLQNLNTPDNLRRLERKQGAPAPIE